MKRFGKTLLLFGMLCKRFLKNRAFLLILLCIPLFMILLKGIAGQADGMIKIVLCAEDNDAETLQWLEEHFATDGVIAYKTIEDADYARQLVTAGKADEAWIFRRNFRERTAQIARREENDKAPVEVFTRENTTVLLLARFQMFATLYPDISYTLYRETVSEEPGFAALTEEEIRACYDNGTADRVLIRHVYEETTGKEKNYVTAPFRGLLALLILLAGLAADMFFLQDLGSGVLDSTPLRKRQGRLYLYQLAAMLPVAVAVTAALLFAGEMRLTLTEAVALLLYLADSLAFCSLVGRLCGNLRRLGAVIPVLMPGLAVLCPVFIMVRRLRPLQYLLPPWYYLTLVQGAETGRYLGLMVLYAAVGFLLNGLLSKKSIKGLNFLS